MSDKAREFVEDVASVEFSTPSLLWVGKVEETATIGVLKNANGLECQYSVELTEEHINEINESTVVEGDWALISVQPFESEETLTVSMKNGEQFVVNVKDAQQIKKVITTADKTLQVTVEVHNENDINHFEDLRVEELAEDTDAYKEAYEAVVSLKGENDEDFDREKCGFLATDIELLDKDGVAFEPEGTVYVKMELLRLPAEESVLTSTMEIQHLALQDGKIDVQTVASGESITKVDEVITAEFSVESFSTFTLTWTNEGTSTVITPEAASTILNIQNESGDTYATVTVHYVDTEGNNIQSPITTAVNQATPVTIAGLLNREISWYKYQGAYYGSYTGTETDQEIASIAVSRISSETTGAEIVRIGNANNGRINNSQSKPDEYNGFYSDNNGNTPIYWISGISGNQNNRFHTQTNNLSNNTRYSGIVYGERPATVTNYSYEVSFDNEAIEPLTNTNTTGVWENAADIYLIYENTDPGKKHATIHYGTLGNGGTFTELRESIVLDTSAASINLL